MTKVEEKLKAGRAKRPEGGSGHSEETQRRSNAGGQASRKDPAPHSSGPPSDAQWQHAISERGEVVCPTCSIVTRKTVHGLKKHMEICQKLQDALKCQQCHKQFRSKAGLNYHTMAEHSTKPSGSEGQTGDEQEERERLRRVLKQMGRIKCPSEGCSAQFSSLMGYQYHQKRCGRELSEDDKPAFPCPHCGKTYRSKAGKDYHVRTEHPAAPPPNAKDCHHARTEHHPAAPNAKDYHHARTEHPAAPNAKDYHARTEHHPNATNSTANSKDATAATTDTNNNTGKERVICEESPSSGGSNRKEPSQPDRKEWPERTTTTTTATCCWPKEKERDTAREKEKEREKEAREREREREQRDRVKKTEQQQPPLKSSSSSTMGEDLDRTPSGRVRRRSAQVAVFHLQEIAEDELAKDWGTKRRIKDDLVPDSKRLNYTRPGLPNFSPELLETWKNEVKEKGFICCTNSNCEAVYSSVSGLKAHLANCSQGGGELGKYTCLICQKEFSSESGVKYHISKTHAQNWFRTAAPTHTVTSSSSKSKAPPETPDGGIKAEVRNGATTTTGKKRGRKPKERPLLAAADSVPTTAKTPGSGTAQNSTPPTTTALSPSSTSTTSPTQTLTTSTTTQTHPTHHQNPSLTPTDSGGGGSPLLNRQPVVTHHAPRRGKPKRVLLPPPE